MKFSNFLIFVFGFAAVCAFSDRANVAGVCFVLAGGAVAWIAGVLREEGEP